jgi:two-component system sensor histidine kinase GlrK
VIDVVDSGPGVPAEERDAIFNSFFRGRAQAGSRIEGTGLGLAIAREFVEAHGGRIAVLAPGGGAQGAPHGAHFRVTLPRKATRVLAAA